MHKLDREELNAGWTLPASYNNESIVLLPRDPYWIFTYWEFTCALSDRFYHEYGSAWSAGHGLLRVYDQDTGRLKDTVINITETGSYHLNVDQAGHTYYVELGKLLPGGHFVPMLKSNPVRTPRDSLSAVIDPRWRMFAFWQNRYFRRMVIGLSSYELFDQTEQPERKGVYSD